MRTISATNRANTGFAHLFYSYLYMPCLLRQIWVYFPWSEIRKPRRLKRCGDGVLECLVLIDPRGKYGFERAEMGFKVAPMLNSIGVNRLSNLLRACCPNRALRVKKR